MSPRIAGRATSEGTLRYRDRLAPACAPGHFRTAGGLALSSLGLGTHLGGPDPATDLAVVNAAVAAAEGGINVFDTAASYRDGKAEPCLGEALARLLATGIAARDELLLCSKGGYIPSREPAAWFARWRDEHPDSGVSAADLCAGEHCLHPAFLRHQLGRSLDRLGVETLDVYYLHNPEIQLSQIPRAALEDRLRAAFAALEEEAAEGRIGAYGLAVWDTLWASAPDAGDAGENGDAGQRLELERIQDLARQAAGGGPDHFRYLQMPLNLGMPQAMLAPTQSVAGRPLAALAAAHQLGLTVVTSSPLAQSRLLGRLPAALGAALPALRGDAQRALQLARSAPGVTTTLVGMKDPAHVEENLALAAIPPLAPADLARLLEGIAGAR